MFISLTTGDYTIQDVQLSSFAFSIILQEISIQFSEVTEYHPKRSVRDEGEIL